LRWDEVTVTSNNFNTAVPAADLSIWIRRGDDSFSENPDAGEDLVIQYLDSFNNWTFLETFPGNGTPGEIITRTYSLPGAALHNNFAIRLIVTGGSGNDFDYWHVDDVVVTEQGVAPIAGLIGEWRF
jgi:hypothetical protein